MKIVLLGISFLLFGIVLILISSGDAVNLGVSTAFFGLILSIVGTFIKDNHK